MVAGLILSASMFPVVVLVTPLFQLFTSLGWIGQYQAMIIPNISFVLPMTVYILASFFAELPWELEEAARIDGATKAQAFRLVMLPLAAPAVFTTAILAFIAAVNEYLLARLLSGGRTEPVTVAIARFSGNNPLVQPYAAIMAAGLIVTIISGLTAGGVKS
ncbi:Probable sugar ABC transporter, permease protein SugB [Mycobacteroides abscessus subsp. abscessus]|nr:Probable sugar ABC transporter, permease protein SugB [Mycobacteroides abscessus subsp. abscessus]